MKKQLALVLVPALLVLACFPAPKAAASDGDIIMIANLTGTTDKTGYECNTWRVRHNRSNGNTPYGSCAIPTVMVYAELKGASAGGITGIEWAAMWNGGIKTPPPNWFWIPLPMHGANQQLGSAWFPLEISPEITPRGENLVWETCQVGDTNGRIPLYQLTLISTAACGPSQVPPELVLEASGHVLPKNPFYRCPLFTLCDEPAFTKVCLGDNLVLCERQQPPFPNDATCSTSGTFSINTPSAGVGGCTPPPGKLASNSTIENDTWSNLKALYR